METKAQKEVRRLLQLELSSPREVVSVAVNGSYVRDTIWKLPSGRIHRDFGPAVLFGSGKVAWYQYGLLHREDGPAIIESDGSPRYFLNGFFYESEESWLKELNKITK